MIEPNRVHNPHPIFRELPPLMPRFLQRRRVGLPLVPALMEELGLDRGSLFAMLRLHQIQGSYGGEPVTFAQVHAYVPYSHIDDFSEPLRVLKERGLVVEDEWGGISLAPSAEEAVWRLHAGAREYLSKMQPLPPEELEALADQLERAVSGIMADPLLSPRPGSHLAGSRSLATFGDEAHPMVRIEQAIHDLWMARDDAHMYAWREAEMEGPPMSVITLLWRAEAGTVGELAELLKGQQTPAHIESSLAYLIEKEYVTRDGDAVQLTPEGVLAREDIERETDRVYFAPWPHTQEEAEWVRDKLRELIDRLPSPPQ